MASSSSSSSAKSGQNGTATPSQKDVDDQIAQLRADISSLTDTVQRMGTGKVHDVQRKAADVTHDAAEVYGDALSSLRGEVEDLESKVTSRVRSNPLQAIGIAAGIGFVIAMITRN